MKKEERIKELNDRKLKILKISKDFIDYEDGEGYRYSKNIYNRGNFDLKHKYDTKNPYCFYNIDLSLSFNNPYNTEIIKDSYKGGSFLATFKCGRCGKEFSGLIGNVLKYKYKICSDCVREIQGTKLQNYKDICDEVSSYGYKLLTKTWEGNHSKIDVEDKFGYKGRTKIETLRTGGDITRYAIYNPYTLDNIRLYCKKENLDCTIPNQKFLGCENKIKVKCSCGKIFKINIFNLINGKRTKCDSCNKKLYSKNEEIIKYYLEQNNIKYIRQYKFIDCKYKNMLPFDFYLPNKNILIEVQGEQHFKPIKYFGGEKAFQETQKRDKIKFNYCKNKNIKLIYINYSDIKSLKYKEILSNLL